MVKWHTVRHDTAYAYTLENIPSGDMTILRVKRRWHVPILMASQILKPGYRPDQVMTAINKCIALIVGRS